MAAVPRETVGEVDQRVRAACQPAALVDPDGWPDVGPATEGGTRRPERAGHDEDVTRSRAAAPRDALGRTDRRDAQDDPGACARVAADHGRTGLGEALIQLHYVRHRRVGWRDEGDDESLRLGAGRGQIAQVDGGSSEAEVAPGDPVQPEVNVLDEHIL